MYFMEVPTPKATPKNIKNMFFDHFQKTDFYNVRKKPQKKKDKPRPVYHRVYPPCGPRFVTVLLFYVGLIYFWRNCRTSPLRL